MVLGIVWNRVAEPWLGTTGLRTHMKFSRLHLTDIENPRLSVLNCLLLNYMLLKPDPLSWLLKMASGVAAAVFALPTVGNWHNTILLFQHAYYQFHSRRRKMRDWSSLAGTTLDIYSNTHRLLSTGRFIFEWRSHYCRNLLPSLDSSVLPRISLEVLRRFHDWSRMWIQLF